MEGREEGAEKVSAGETAVCRCCGSPFAQALGEADTCQRTGGLLEDGNDAPEWIFRDWKKAIERDQALIEAARQRREELLSRHRAVREKARALLCSLTDGQDDQGLLADLDMIEVGIRGIFGEPCSPHDR